MRKRRAPPTNEEIVRAVEQAANGKPRALARLIKRCSVQDLTSGLKIFAECYGARPGMSPERALSYRGYCEDGLRGIRTALIVAAGRQEARQWRSALRIVKNLRAETGVLGA